MVELKGFLAAALSGDFWKPLRLWNVKWHPNDQSQTSYGQNVGTGSPSALLQNQIDTLTHAQCVSGYWVTSE